MCLQQRSVQRNIQHGQKPVLDDITYIFFELRENLRGSNRRISKRKYIVYSRSYSLTCLLSQIY